METGMAITVNYWVSGDQPAIFDQGVEGLAEFEHDLSENYISLVKGRPAGAGGGASFYVTIISNLNFSHLVALIVDGIAFDLLKNGARAFVLRPFIGAFKKLCKQNNYDISLSELRIEFRDSSIIIHDILVANAIDHIGEILVKLANNYERLATKDGMYPDRIHIPVIEDQKADRVYRFRIIENFDEVLRANGAQDYLGFWGLEYDRTLAMRIFDVNRQVLIDDRYYTLGEYYSALDRREKI